MSRILFLRDSSSVFDSLREFATECWQETVPLRQVMRVLGGTSKAFAQAVFDENWPLLKASIANSSRFPFGNSVMMDMAVEKWYVGSYSGEPASDRAAWCPAQLGVQLRYPRLIDKADNDINCR